MKVPPDSEQLHDGQQGLPVQGEEEYVQKTRVYPNPDQTYDHQEDLRVKYVKDNVKKTVQRLSTYLIDLYDAFCECGRKNGHAPRPNLEAHREWVEFYETGSLVPFRQGSYFTTFGLSSKKDQQEHGAQGEEAKTEATAILEKRALAMVTLEEGIHWSAVKGNGRNPADDLYHFRSMVLGAVSELFTQRGDGDVLVFPSREQVEVRALRLIDELTAEAPAAEKERLRQFDDLMQEMLGPEGEWFGIEVDDETADGLVPIRFHLHGIIPSPGDVYEYGPKGAITAGTALRDLRKDLQHKLEADGYSNKVTTDYNKYKSSFTSWCLRPSHEVLNPCLSENGQACGIEIISPFLRGKEDFAQFNAMMEELKMQGFRTNSTTPRSYDLLTHHVNLRQVIVLTHHFLEAAGADPELLNAVIEQKDIKSLTALVTRSGYEEVSLEWVVGGQGQGNIDVVCVNAGCGAPDKKFSTNVIKKLENISKQVVPPLPKKVVIKVKQPESVIVTTGASLGPTGLKATADSATTTPEPAETELTRAQNERLCVQLEEILQNHDQQATSIDESWALYASEMGDVSAQAEQLPMQALIRRTREALEVGKPAREALSKLLDIEPEALTIVRSGIPMTGERDLDSAALPASIAADRNLDDLIATATEGLSSLRFDLEKKSGEPDPKVEISSRLAQAGNLLVPVREALEARRAMTRFNEGVASVDTEPTVSSVIAVARERVTARGVQA